MKIDARGARDHVPGVGVFRDERERPLRSVAADQDLRPRRRDRPWITERIARVHSPSLEGCRVAGPGLPRETQSVLEEGVPLAEVRERDTERFRFAPEPCGADAEVRAPTCEHVDRGGRLYEDGGRPVDDSRYEDSKAD